MVKPPSPVVGSPLLIFVPAYSTVLPSGKVSGGVTPIFMADTFMPSVASNPLALLPPSPPFPTIPPVNGAPQAPIGARHNIKNIVFFIIFLFLSVQNYDYIITHFISYAKVKLYQKKYFFKKGTRSKKYVFY